jgi:predicted NAD/FAD-dependent oxidoreductase
MDKVDEPFDKGSEKEKFMRRVLNNPLKNLDSFVEFAQSPSVLQFPQDASYISFQNLAAAINDFDNNLANNYETLIVINGMMIKLERVTWLAPSFVRLGGNLDGKHLELIQNSSNFSLILVANPKNVEEPARQPIGFYSESTDLIEQTLH